MGDYLWLFWALCILVRLETQGYWFKSGDVEPALRLKVDW
jgi:hypothetical protein